LDEALNHDPAAPLYHRIKEDLRAAIRRRDYTTGAPFITQRELCERYGVSTTTAIRALNDLVAEGILVRRRGQGTFVAEPTEPELAPRPDGTRPRTVGCIVHGIGGPHVTGIISGVESMCSELGYQMVLADSNGSPEREARALQEMVRADVSGVVAYPVQGRANIDAYGQLRNVSIPLVLVDRYLPELATDAVLPDHFAIGYEVTNRLVELGHRNLAMLWSETESTSVQERLSGHERSLREHGLPVRPGLTVTRRYWSEAEGTHPSLLRDLLADSDPPSVLLCANGYVLAAAAINLMDLGIEFPEQIELAGMDDAGPFEPLPITTVAAVLPSRELGREAMRLLAERIATGERQDDGRRIVLPISLSTRESAVGYLRAVSGARP
jgi:GntR family transcriptional regulator, arabinose operon transcriptional repressor